MSSIQLNPLEFAGLDPQPLTEIRRPLDPQPELSDGVWYWKGTFLDWEAFNIGNSQLIHCPFGAAGDHLRVLEEWWSDDEDGCYYRKEGNQGWWWERVGERCMPSPGGGTLSTDEWNPAETLPPWASRYVLEIVSVGVELYEGEWTWVIEVRSEA